MWKWSYTNLHAMNKRSVSFYRYLLLWFSFLLFRWTIYAFYIGFAICQTNESLTPHRRKLRFTFYLRDGSQQIVMHFNCHIDTQNLGTCLLLPLKTLYFNGIHNTLHENSFLVFFVVTNFVFFLLSVLFYVRFV